MRLHTTIVLSIAFCFTGCGARSITGQSVSGSVTIEGKQLAEGIITFVPVAETIGSKVTAMIVDGKYQIDSTEGLGFGKFRVEIMGIPPGIKAMAEGKQVIHAKEIHKSSLSEAYREIASEFNEQSKLECNVVSGAANAADFEVRYAPTNSQQ